MTGNVTRMTNFFNYFSVFTRDIADINKTLTAVALINKKFCCIGSVEFVRCMVKSGKTTAVISVVVYNGDFTSKTV